MGSWLKPEALISLNCRLCSTELIAVHIFQWQMCRSLHSVYGYRSHVQELGPCCICLALVFTLFCCIFLVPGAPLGWVFFLNIATCPLQELCRGDNTLQFQGSPCCSNSKFRTGNQPWLADSFIVLFQGPQLTCVLCFGFYTAHYLRNLSTSL